VSDRLGHPEPRPSGVFQAYRRLQFREQITDPGTISAMSLAPVPLPESLARIRGADDLHSVAIRAGHRAATERLGISADTIVEVDGIGPQAALVAAARV
jgi:hypothetical protein